MDQTGISIFRNGTQRLRYERSVFPGGEVHVRLEERGVFKDTDYVFVYAHVHDSVDVMALLLLTDALRRKQCRQIHLVLPYLPYARQDRVCAPGESLSLKVFTSLINAQGYTTVEVWDPHSDVALALLDRAHALDPYVFLDEIHNDLILDWSKLIMVAPDAGAIKKVHRASEVLKRPYVRADKTRDPETGAITGTRVYSDHVGDANFLMVDDICDGGRTFIELARELRKLTHGRVMLYVTHGIFSRGPEVFDGLIDRVFYATTFRDGLPSHFLRLNPARL